MPTPRKGAGLNFVNHLCCGGVVLDTLGDTCRVVLIEVTKGRYPQWLLPKGHVEPGEQHEAAAIREVSEETGIPKKDLKVLAYLGKIDYQFPPIPRNELHRKTVHYYVMLAKSTELSLSQQTHEEGISRANWFAIESAKEVVRYKGNREMIDRAQDILNQLLSKEQAGKPGI